MCNFTILESLDELEKMVVNLFSQVKDKSVEAPRWETHPFNEAHFGTCVYMYPIKDVRNLNIVFPCPDLQKHYKSSVSVSSKGKNVLQFFARHRHLFLSFVLLAGWSI